MSDQKSSSSSSFTITTLNIIIKSLNIRLQIAETVLIRGSVVLTALVLAAVRILFLLEDNSMRGDDSRVTVLGTVIPVPITTTCRLNI